VGKEASGKEIKVELGKIKVEGAWKR